MTHDELAAGVCLVCIVTCAAVSVYQAHSLDVLRAYAQGLIERLTHAERLVDRLAGQLGQCERELASLKGERKP